MKFTYNKEKTLNAILYISTNVAKLGFHKLFKLLYFSDQSHLLKYGRVITGDNYVAMPKGPVPSILYDKLCAIRNGEDSKVEQDFSNCILVVKSHYIETTKESDLNTLSKTDLHELNSAIRKFGDKSFDELTEASHGYAWENTTLNSVMDFGNIMKEKGGDVDDLNYATEQAQIRQFFA